MAPASRKTSRVKSKELSKENVFPGGKENARPSTSTRSRKLSAGAEAAAQPVPKIRVSLAPKAEQPNESVVSRGRTFSSVGQSIRSRRAPFSVHHDQKAVLDSRPGREKVQPCASVVDHGVKAAATDRAGEQSPWRGEGSKIPRKRAARPTEICGARNKDECPCKPRCAKESQIDQNQLPSKIPRRTRSTSVPAIETQSRVCSKRSGSVGPRVGLLSSRKPGTPALQRQRQRQQEDAKSRLSRILRRKNVVEVERKGGKPGGDEGARRVLLEPRSASTETPSDCALPAPPSAPVPLKSAFHRSKQRAIKSEEIEQRLERESNEREPFPAELFLQAEYFNDIPIVECRREESSPELSRSFLKSNMNAEQRRLVVLFLIRIGSHYHYPSYVIYQAVKLFDAAMDRISVTTMFIQMVALASLWIALKRLENFHRIPTANKIVKFANELYAGRQDWLLDYERKILLALDFNITFADAFTLYNYHLLNCKRFLHVSAETTKHLYYCGGYLIDVTLLDEEFCRASAGLIAVTAAELAFGLVLDTIVSHSRPRWLFWRGLLFAGASHVIGRFRDEEIDRSRVVLLRQLLSSSKKHSSFEVVYRKYSRSQYGRVSEWFLERANRVSQVETFNP